MIDDDPSTVAKTLPGTQEYIVISFAESKDIKRITFINGDLTLGGANLAGTNVFVMNDQTPIPVEQFTTNYNTGNTVADQTYVIDLQTSVLTETIGVGSGANALTIAEIWAEEYIDVIDGGWGEWGSWTACSESCGGGTQDHSRVCDSPAPADGGADCTGEAAESQDCNTYSCDSTAQARIILYEHGNFEGGSITITEFEQGDLPDNFLATMSSWKNIAGQWKMYQEKGFKGLTWTSEPGDEQNIRSDYNDAIKSIRPLNIPSIVIYDEKDHTGSEFLIVMETKCPLPPEWDNKAKFFIAHHGDWLVFEDNRAGKTQIINEGDQTNALFEGVSCVQLGIDIDGGWYDWLEWTPCTLPCQTHIALGHQNRTRICRNPQPRGTGQPCPEEEKMERRDCNTHMCPIDGGWAEWGQWTSCNTICGGGKRSRSRTCTFPAQEGAGNPCPENSVDEEDCNTDSCDHWVMPYGSSCSQQNGCFSFPNECADTFSCAFKLQWESVAADEMEFKVSGMLANFGLMSDEGSQNMWIGFGLSKDGMMCFSRIYVCMKRGHHWFSRIVYGKFHDLEEQYVIPKGREMHDGDTVTYDAAYQYGRVFCKFRVGKDDLPAEEQHLFYGMGPSTRDGLIIQHYETPKVAINSIVFD